MFDACHEAARRGPRFAPARNRDFLSKGAARGLVLAGYPADGLFLLFILGDVVLVSRQFCDSGDLARLRRRSFRSEDFSRRKAQRHALGGSSADLFRRGHSMAGQSASAPACSFGIHDASLGDFRFGTSPSVLPLVSDLALTNQAYDALREVFIRTDSTMSVSAWRCDLLP